MKGSIAIAKILKQEGVEFISCFPINPVIEAGAIEGIRPVMARTERAAVNIADGFTRVSNGRRNGVVAMQYQPGVENAFGGVAQAYSDSVPILVIPAASPRRTLGVPPDFRASQSYHSITKWADLINLPERIPEMMRRAFTQLRMGRPGPVMVEVPMDVYNAELEDSAVQYEPVKWVRTAPDPQDVVEAVRALLAAKAPLIHAGQGVLYAEAWDELREFAELIPVPVMTTLPGKSAFPEDHPLSVGSGGNTRTDGVVHFLNKADLVFGIGCSFTRTAFAAIIPPGKVMIHSSVDERDINKDYRIDQAILGDAKLVLRQMIEEAKRQLGPGGRRDNKEAAQEVKGVKETWLKKWMPKLTSDEVPINPYRLIWDLRNTLDRTKTIITHDSGHPRDQIAPFWETLIPHGFIGWGKSTQLGTSMGLSIGAKLAAPDKTVAHLLGDAAFGMCGMDFETAVRNKTPILTVLMNNSLLGGYDRHLHVATERYSTRYISGNYTKVAEGLGGYTERIEQPKDIIPAIKRCLHEMVVGRPALLEVITREEEELCNPGR